MVSIGNEIVTQSICLTAPHLSLNIGLAIRLSISYIMSVLGTCPPHMTNCQLILWTGFGWALPIPNPYYHPIHLMAPFQAFNIRLDIRLSIYYIQHILPINSANHWNEQLPSPVWLPYQMQPSLFVLSQVLPMLIEYSTGISNLILPCPLLSTYPIPSHTKY